MRGVALFSRTLAGAHSEDEIYHALAVTIEALLGVRGAYVFSHTRGMLQGAVAAHREEEEALTDLALSPSDAVFQRLCELGQPVGIAARDLAEVTEAEWPFPGEWIDFFPLSGSSGCLGAVAVSMGRDLLLEDSQRALIEALSIQAGLNLERLRISSWAADEYCHAEEGREQLESFVYTATHALKGPLSTLRALTRLLRAEGSDLPEDEWSCLLERVEHNAGRMQMLIRDLLEYANVSQDEGERQPVDLADLVEGLRIDLSELFEQKGATLRMDGRLPVVQGSRTNLREVFRNLMENAAIYGGPEAEVEIGAETDGGWTRAWVRDSGPGIAADWLERVQRPFTRGPGANAANPEGTGMGLAIVKRVVEWHGGELTVESNPGLGTCFYLTLPTQLEASD